MPLDQSELSLHYLLREPQIAITKPPLAILLHGYGSNEADLFDLAPSFPPEFLVISARAPQTLDEGHYAWFALDFTTKEIAHNREQAEESRLVLKKFIDDVIEKFSVDREQVFLIGFSQGAMLSASAALTFPSLIKGIGMLSGRILEETKSKIKASDELHQLKVFLAHGMHDTVLPIDRAHEAKAYFETLGVDLTYHEYPIAHGISPDEARDLIEWMSNSSKNNRR